MGQKNNESEQTEELKEKNVNEVIFGTYELDGETKEIILTPSHNF